MYVCGPTVYNDIHIGNARSIVAFDTIRRYLTYRGYEVRFISNFTDVDDKMIKRADEEGISVYELANRFISRYEADTLKINVQAPTVRTRATDFIPQIVDFISKLLIKGYAYQSEGDVYFRTRKFKSYGKLSDQTISQLLVGASEHVNLVEQNRKEDLLDFALWKGQKGHEIAWDAPFGKGRPGWHIECSAMAFSELGKTIDLHGGGEDLEFPHHENERAQSESLTGQTFVRYWMHNAFVTVNNDEKMSKSLNNFVTLHQAIADQGANFMRFFLVQTNYRKPLQYSETSLAQAKRNYQRLINTMNALKELKPNDSLNEFKREEFASQVKNYREKFITAMDDDFNVQNALSVVYECLKWVNKEINRNQIDRKILVLILNLLTEWFNVFGIKEDGSNEITDEYLLDLINKRNQARQERNFKLSDQLRDQLIKLGVSIEDTLDGSKYKIK